LNLENFIGNGISMVESFFVENKTIETLDLSCLKICFNRLGIGLNDEGMRILCKGLSKNTSVYTLKIDGSFWNN
jgi:hypothetical protein